MYFLDHYLIRNITFKFSKVQRTDRRKEKKVSRQDSFHRNDSDSFNFSCFTNESLIDIVKDMKNKTSKNLLALSNCFLKSIINCIAEPLVHIFNLSLRKGEIPQQLKCAKVVPIFKLKKSVNDEHLDPSFYIDLFHYCLFSQRFLKKM